MNASPLKETADILKRLSPQNQIYFMTLVRVAETAENGVKNALVKQPRKAELKDSVHVSGKEHGL